MSSAVGALRGLALQVELFCPENAAGRIQDWTLGTNCLEDRAKRCFVVFPVGHIATTEQCLQRLVLGGIKLAVVLQASTAAHAVKQQRLLANYNLPENTIVVTAQPRTLAVCLRQASTVDLPSLTLYFPGYLTSNKGICRSIAVKLGVEAPAVGFAAAETQDAAAACKCAGVQHLQLSHSHVTVTQVETYTGNAFSLTLWMAMPDVESACLLRCFSHVASPIAVRTTYPAKKDQQDFERLPKNNKPPNMI